MWLRCVIIEGIILKVTYSLLPARAALQARSRSSHPGQCYGLFQVTGNTGWEESAWHQPEEGLSEYLVQ